eukprot:Skav213374  [mRNA]  locus=scaffold797:88585:91779:+ [translate_table: standard]
MRHEIESQTEGPAAESAAEPAAEPDVETAVPTEVPATPGSTSSESLALWRALARDGGQQNSRKCPKCGKLAKGAGDYTELRSCDNPRTSTARSSTRWSSDSASVHTDLSAANAAPVPYKWICRPSEAHPPFAEDSPLFELECRWPKAVLPDVNRVNRVWAFFRNGRNGQQIVAQACGFPVVTACACSVTQWSRRDNHKRFCFKGLVRFDTFVLEDVEANSIHQDRSEPCDSEEDAVKDILKVVPATASRRTRWGRALVT